MEATPAVNRWDATPGQAGVAETPGRIVEGSRWDAADGGAAAQAKARNRWDATPTPGGGAGPGETPTAGGKRSRWDATPAMAAVGATPAYGAGGGLGATPAWGAATPAGGVGMETPTPGMLAAQQAALGGVPLTPEAYQQMRVDREMDERNRCAGVGVLSLQPACGVGLRVGWRCGACAYVRLHRVCAFVLSVCNSVGGAT